MTITRHESLLLSRRLRFKFSSVYKPNLCDYPCVSNQHNVRCSTRFFYHCSACVQQKRVYRVVQNVSPKQRLAVPTVYIIYGPKQLSGQRSLLLLGMCGIVYFISVRLLFGFCSVFEKKLGCGSELVWFGSVQKRGSVRILYSYLLLM